MKVKRTFVTVHLEQLSKSFPSKPFSAVLWKKGVRQSLHLSVTLFMLHSSYLLLSCGQHVGLCMLSGSFLWPRFQYKIEREIEPPLPQVYSCSNSVASVSVSAINFWLTGRISFLPHAQVPYIEMHCRHRCIFLLWMCFACSSSRKWVSANPATIRDMEPHRHPQQRLKLWSHQMVMFPPGNMPKKSTALGCSGVKQGCSYTWLCYGRITLSLPYSSLFFMR